MKNKSEASISVIGGPHDGADIHGDMTWVQVGGTIGLPNANGGFSEYKMTLDESGNKIFKFKQNDFEP